MSLPDRVFRLIGNKPRLGAGRPSSPCHCRRRPSGVYWRPSGSPAPVREHDTRGNGGFCSIRRVLSACRWRVAPLMVQFPPFGGGEVAVRGGEVAVRGGEVAPRVVRSRFAGMWRPQCRPPRRTMAGMGVMAQMFCDAGDSGTQFTSATPPHPGLDGGFCSIRRVLSACRRRVAPLMVQFPPFGGDVTGRQVTHGSPCSASPHSLLSVRSRLGAVWRPGG